MNELDRYVARLPALGDMEAAIQEDLRSHIA